ncbi:hypothetical protein BDZ90DRAFT_56475 [Jaminaea rosea]|uniref:Uncharacterized protein n=1 Tax=Jaminaea rosea TaxID=1569628 RepID=A0A316USA6_9BASI|nr:hypothetical protein BDZ90DRAFT_56475 [Jaminaea rosea]PWN26015.1 hypothetical protein BDZ90DRAFT_56475 [Jaminaea rosea]
MDVIGLRSAEGLTGGERSALAQAGYWERSLQNAGIQALTDKIAACGNAGVDGFAGQSIPKSRQRTTRRVLTWSERVAEAQGNDAAFAKDLEAHADMAEETLNLTPEDIKNRFKTDTILTFSAASGRSLAHLHRNLKQASTTQAAVAADKGRKIVKKLTDALTAAQKRHARQASSSMARPATDHADD